MIVAVADDFTGAAEIGGIGLRYGMKVEIATEVRENCEADLFVVATNSRSKTSADARLEAHAIFSRISRMKVPPRFIYKKTDSVLRGHVLVELKEQMKVLNRKRAILVPANPQFGRVIINGDYYINGKKLNDTDFRDDPEFAAATSGVVSILRKETPVNIQVLKQEAVFPEEGVFVGEVSSNDDLKVWAEKVEDDMAVAGASGFFTALLEEQGFSVIQKESKIQYDKQDKKMLFVCGSAYAGSRQLIRKALSAGRGVSLMPEGLTVFNKDKQKLLDQWASDICSKFNDSAYVIISANPEKKYNKRKQTEVLCSNTGAVTKKVVDNFELDELVLEGGSTAFSVLKELGLNRFIPVEELAYGVIRMTVPGYENLHFTLKPGSYMWPPSLWPVGESQNK